MATQARISIEPGTLLSCIPLFAGLRPDQLSCLGAACRVIEIPASRSLYGAGQTIREAHFLVTGSIKRFVMLSDKAEKVLEIVRPAQLLAMSEILSATSYASFAETLEPSVVVAIAIDTLRELAGTDPTLCMRLLESMAQRHYAAEFEIVRHRSLSGTQRVLDYLLSLAGDRRRIAGETTVRLNASKSLIASQLDMAPETFSRTLNQLSKDGVIVVEGRLVHLQNATLAVETRHAEGESSSNLLYFRQERGAAPELPSPTALVNLCGRHRMLSQRLAAEWNVVASGLAPRAAKVALRKYREQFQRNLDYIAALVIPDSLRQHLDSMHVIWRTYSDALAVSPPDSVNAEHLFDLSESLLQAADALTTKATELADTLEARRVNIAGRNRMLCARLTKLFLFGVGNVRVAETARLIAESRDEFQRNMEALAASSSDTPEALAQLQVDATQWQRFLDAFDQQAAPGADRAHALAVLAAGEELMRHVDTTVKLFERLTPNKPAAKRPVKSLSGFSGAD